MITMAVAAFSLIPLVFLFMRDWPHEKGLPPYGETEVQQPPPLPQRNFIIEALSALRTGLASRDYCLLAASFFICGASTNGLIGTHMIAACHDYGIAQVQSAQLLAMMGIFDIIGTTASGAALAMLPVARARDHGGRARWRPRAWRGQMPYSLGG